MDSFNRKCILLSGYYDLLDDCCYIEDSSPEFYIHVVEKDLRISTNGETLLFSSLNRSVLANIIREIIVWLKKTRKETIVNAKIIDETLSGEK